MPRPKVRNKTMVNKPPGASHGSGLLSQFHCRSIAYNFTIPMDSFNQKTFSRRTGIKVGEHWNTGIYPKNTEAGYHVHFSGRLEKDEVSLTVEYSDGSFAKQDDGMPGAESIMEWIGSLVRELSWRTHVHAVFEKPLTHWRSLFNLPFKVTMVGQEVIIDGITLQLPKNPSRAFHAFVMMADTTLDASINFHRIVEFASFRLHEELPALNGAVKIFAEETIAP